MMPFAPTFLAVLCGLMIFFLPGYLLRRWLFPSRWPLLAEVPLSFSLSLAVGALAWLTARLAGGKLLTLGVALAVAVVALAIAIVLRRRGRVVLPPSQPETRGLRTWLALLPVAVAVLFWAWVVFRVGASYMPESDNWYYLAVVRRILVAGNLVPGDPFFAGVADAGRSGPWLSLVALWVRLSGVDLMALWELLPGLVMPLALLAFYFLAWSWFHNHWVASLAVFLTLAGRTGFTWNEPMMMAAPSNIALLLLFVGLGLAIEYGRKGGWGYLAMAVLLAGTVAAQHILVLGGMLLMVAVFAVAQLVMSLIRPDPDAETDKAICPAQWRKAGLRLLLVLAPSALVAMPVVLFWGQSLAGTTNPIYSDLWGLFKAIGPWHVLRVSSLSGGPHLFAFSFLLLPLLLVKVRRHDCAALLIGVMVLVVLIAFTPPIVEAILRIGVLPPWGIWRLASQIYPFQFTVAACVCWGAQAMWPAVLSLFGGRRWTSVMAVGGLLLVGLVPNATPLLDPLLNYVQMARQGRPMEDAVAWLGTGPLAALPQSGEPMVVLSDISTSYYISGLTGHYVVAIPYGHASPLVPDDQERRGVVAGVLTVGGSMDSLRALLRRYDARALVLVARPDLGSHVLSSEAWRYWVEALDAAGDEFILRFRDETGGRRAAVYLWRPDEREP